MKLTKIATAAMMSAALAAGAVGAGLGVAQATTTTSSPTCLPAADAWPAPTQGQPPRSPGVAVWHDGTGWHVRVTHNTLHDRVFSGEIATTGELVAVRGYQLERNDALTVGPGKHVLRFRLNNYGHIDGVDFATACAPQLEFGLVTDGQMVPVARIAIGADSHHPAHNPFVITRSA